MTHVNLALVGFGNVGRSFAILLLQMQSQLEQQYGLTFQVNGIATGRHGMAIDPAGLDLSRALSLVQNGESIGSLSTIPEPKTVFEFIETCPAEVLFENSPANHFTGEPAISYLKAALEHGLHCITANKGPVALGMRELTELAASKNRFFQFESSVMDGAPIFNLVRETLPAAKVLSLRGILNSTSNLMLDLMEKGRSFEETIAFAQTMGVTESNPDDDIDGWDAAVKIAILTTSLMGVPIRPDQVERTGIRDITPAMIASARAAGLRWKLVCSAVREGQTVHARVAPEQVGPESNLYTVGASSSCIGIELDLLPGLFISKGESGPDTTAYGLLVDLLTVVKRNCES